MAEASALPLASILTHATARALVVQLFGRAQREGWPFLSDLCADAFKRERVPVPYRGLVATVLRAMVRHRRSVEVALGWQDGTGDDLLRLRATLVRLGLEAAADVATSAEELLALGAVERLEDRLAGLANPVERLAVQHSLPDWLAARLMAELGAERAPALAAALNQDAPVVLRVNLARTTRDEVLAQLQELGVSAEATARSLAGLRVEASWPVWNSGLYRDGLVEVQDEASQLVAEVVAPPPGGLVVDACAGAGGKTLALGAALHGKGRLVALDISGHRLEELRRRARRAGLSSVQAILLSREGGGAIREADVPVLQKLQGAADRVLVDAPCSGLGALRRNPEARWRLKEEDIPRLAAQQRALVEQALANVAPRGRVIYATCTFLRAECEDVLEAVLAAHPEFERVRVKEVLGGARAAGITDPSGTDLRTWPDLHGMDGFYAGVLRRKAR